MPHAVLRLVPGDNTQETPALNENSGISQSQLVRFFPDPSLGALVQKLGGWLKFFPTAMAATVRALWAWEDLNDNAHLAVGTTNIIGSTPTHAQLAVITSGTLKDIKPIQVNTVNILHIAMTGGSALVEFTDGTPFEVK